jgi:hypothetical protein
VQVQDPAKVKFAASGVSNEGESKIRSKIKNVVDVIADDASQIPLTIQNALSMPHEKSTT